jgi:2-polyprenyl-6-methoxyphenol hydroxylase-like FAD-dependent oxidoreductase
MAGRGASLDIAIVGCGPSGMAAALFLSRAGHRITVFERFDAPRPVGAGLLLQPTGLAVLGRLGLLAKVAGALAGLKTGLFASLDPADPLAAD